MHHCNHGHDSSHTLGRRTGTHYESHTSTRGVRVLVATVLSTQYCTRTSTCTRKPYCTSTECSTSLLAARSMSLVTEKK